MVRWMRFSRQPFPPRVRLRRLRGPGASFVSLATPGWYVFGPLLSAAALTLRVRLRRSFLVPLEWPSRTECGCRIGCNPFKGRGMQEKPSTRDPSFSHLATFNRYDFGLGVNAACVVAYDS